MQILELNLKKLANYADESIALRQYVFEDDELISAQIKGVINETRASKFAFNDPRIRQDQFTLDYNRLQQANFAQELRMPNFKKRKFTQAFGEKEEAPADQEQQHQVVEIFRSKRIMKQKANQRELEKKKYMQIFVEAIMDSDRTAEVHKLF